MSLARSFLSDPHGMIFIHASCDQPLMNSPITKLSFVILSATKNLLSNARFFAMLKITDRTTHNNALTYKHINYGKDYRLD